MSHRKKGFTFLEIIIAVLVIGILTAVAMPKLVELRREAVESAEKYTVGSIRAGIANWYAKSVINTAGSPVFPSALDLAALGNAAPTNPLFTEVLQPTITSKWRKTSPYSYFGPVREYFYNKNNGTFDPVFLGQDLSANSNNGTANGAGLISDSPYSRGSSMNFDGVNDYISLPNIDALNFGSGDFTIDLWAKFDSTSGAQVLLGRNGQSDRSWSFYYWDGNLRFAWQGASYHDQAFAWTASPDQWHHIATVRDGTELKVFVDGSQVGTTYNIGTDTIRSATSEIFIGENVQDRGYYFNGNMTDIRVSDIARYTTAFTPPTEPVVADENTVGLWR